MSTNDPTPNNDTETGSTTPPTTDPADELDSIIAGEAGAGRLAALDGLSRLQLDALFALAGEGACSGAAIRDALSAVYGSDTNVSRRIYGHLDDLAERGLLAKRDEGPHTRTNTYCLTTTGHDAIDAYREWAGQCLLPHPTAPTHTAPDDADGDDDDPPATGAGVVQAPAQSTVGAGGW